MDTTVATLSARRSNAPNTFTKLDVSAHVSREDYAQRATACLQAAARAETDAEHDRWMFEAVAWHELARATREGSGEWPTIEQQRARRLG